MPENENEHRRRNEVIRAIRGYYDPLHTITVTLACKKCEWTDKFTVKMIPVKEKKK